jgi:hypothetical protein
LRLRTVVEGNDVRRTTALLLLAPLLVTGCKELTSADAAPTPTGSVSTSTGVALPVDLAVAVSKQTAVVTWRRPSAGAPVRAYELRLDARQPVRLAATATSHRLTGLAAGSQHTVALVAVTAAGRSPAVTALFTLPEAPVAPTAAPPRGGVTTGSVTPKGEVVIDRFERLRDQTRYGCDRLAVTLHNRSTAPVRSVTVGFVTYWGGEQLGSGTQRGRDISLTQERPIAAGAKQTLRFDVCLPEKKTRNVYGQPVSTRWVWA